MQTFVVAFLAILACVTAAKTEPPATEGAAKMLFCAHGFASLTPRPVPPGFDSYLALAVVEINSPRDTTNTPISEFELFDESGKATKMKRIINVDNFDEPGVFKGDEEFYFGTNPSGGTRPWNGALPAGRIRLRIHASLVEAPGHAVRCKLKIGDYVVEGPVNGLWPP
jgi:hypothetical protein